MQQTIKKIALTSLAVFGLSITTISNVNAWGPERPTFTMESPASYPVFNSITNNPTIGDERNFVRVGEIDADVTELSDEVTVVPGRQYLVYIYFHNNASSTYNDSAHNNVGVAVRTRMSSSFSTVITPTAKGTITGTITADNSNPTSVWDEAYMVTSTDKILLHYVSGSAKIYNDWGTNGSVMPSSLFTEEGTLVGLNTLNGVIPGCEEYHGVVTYVLQAEELGGSIDKTISKDGNIYGESANAAPGDEVSYQLAITNTGDTALTNVTVKDTLPAGLELVSGSVGLRANDSTTVETLSDNILGTGYNLGTLGTGNTVYITYRAIVTGDYDCTGTELENSATLTYDSEVASGDSRRDSVSLTVRKADCSTPEEPLDNCTTNPSLPGCEQPTDQPEEQPTETTIPERNCATNPEMEGCQKLPDTGPLEIALAITIVLGIGGGGFYYYRTHKKVKAIEKGVSGKDSDKDTPIVNPASFNQTPINPASPKTPETPETSSQNTDNMVK